MLHHQDDPREEAGTRPQTDGPAAEVRVTAEEFARAVARCQARRDQAAQRMEGTVAIGDAVHELGLEASPEEILAEVQAERAAHVTRATAPRARANRLMGVGIPLVLLAATAFWTMRLQPPADPNASVSTPAQVVVAPSPSPFVTVSAPETILVMDTHNGKPVLRTLSEIPDDLPVQCDLDMTESRAAFANFGAGEAFANVDMKWTLVKHHGQLYVRGWIAAMSPQAVTTSAVSIYNHKDLVPSGFTPTPVTVRLDGFQTNPALGADDTISAVHIQPDAHFTEPWRQ